MTKSEIEKIKFIAKKAGKKVLEIYKSNFFKKKKKDNSFLTKADLLSEKIILERLEDFGYPILSEEKKDDFKRLNSDTLFIIDPLDGTHDFVEKTDDFSIMIGLVKNKKPVMGVVYKPIGDKLYFAQKGKGSFLEEKGKTKKLTVSSKKDLNQSTFVMSRFHLSKLEEKFINKGIIKDNTKRGSIGIKVGLIAEGKAEGYINTSNKTCQWDTCAPEIILKEAGGEITDLDGNKLKYNSKKVNNENGVVATNGKIHSLLLKQI